MEQTPLNQMPSSSKRIDDMASILMDGPEAVDVAAYQEEDSANKPAITSPDVKKSEDETSSLAEERASDEPIQQRRRAEDNKPRELSQVTHNHVEQAASELTQAMKQVQELYESNQLSQEQYAIACQNAQQMVGQISQLNLAAKENELNFRQSHQRQYEELVALVPEVAKDGGKAAKERMVNFAAKHGFTEAELRQVMTPKVAKFLLDMEKASRPKSNVTKIPQRTKQHEPRNDNRELSANRGRGGDIDAIARILMGG